MPCIISINYISGPWRKLSNKNWNSDIFALNFEEKKKHSINETHPPNLSLSFWTEFILNRTNICYLLMYFLMVEVLLNFLLFFFWMKGYKLEIFEFKLFLSNVSDLPSIVAVSRFSNIGKKEFWKISWYCFWCLFAFD